MPHVRIVYIAGTTMENEQGKRKLKDNRQPLYAFEQERWKVGATIN